MEEEQEKKKEESTKVNKDKRHKMEVVDLILIVILIFGILFSLYVYQSSSNSVLKPIIYLYPEEETNVEVKLDNSELITCSYPKYEESWKVTAYPNGDLIDKKTRKEFIFFVLGRQRYS